MRLLCFPRLNTKDHSLLTSPPRQTRGCANLDFFKKIASLNMHSFLVYKSLSLLGHLPDLVAVELVVSPDLESVLLQELPKQG